MVNGDAQRRRPERAKGQGERGYNLVILTVMVTVLSISLSAALPRWSTSIKREREEEVIFRGLQYAEAIRVFQIRFGRLPVRLKELIDVEPRAIRQLWPNPMREDGRWALIFEGAQGQGRPIRGQRGQRGQRPDRPVRPAGRPGEDGEMPGVVLSGTGDELTEVATGPIRGVYSPTDEDAIKVWFDSSSVSDWKFTFDLLQAPRTGANPAANGQPPPIVNAARIGRPFPPGITPQIPLGGSPGGVPSGRPVGSRPGSPGGPGGAAVDGLEGNQPSPGNSGEEQ